MINKEKIPKTCFILGGGYSVVEGIKLGLLDKLKDYFVIGTNETYKYFNSTFLASVDGSFIENNAKQLKNLPLVITRETPQSLKSPLKNLIICPYSTDTYNRNLSKGVYSNKLVGLFALSLAIYLIDTGVVYLLGFDFGNITEKKDKLGRIYTHWYQDKDLHYNGIGMVSYYKIKNREKLFDVYKNENKVKIYLVGKTNLKTFTNISYQEMFNQIENLPKVNQEEIRTSTKKILNNLHFRFTF